MRWGLFAVFLLIGNLLSALAVVESTHQSRLLESQLQELRLQQDHINTEWAKLQLEEAAWSGLGRIEQIAREKLDMAPPSSYHIVPGAP